MFSRRSLFAALGVSLSSLVAVTAASAATPKSKKPLHAKAKTHSPVKHAKAKSHTAQKPAAVS